MGNQVAKGTKVTIKNGDLKVGHTTLKPAITRKSGSRHSNRKPSSVDPKQRRFVIIDQDKYNFWL